MAQRANARAKLAGQPGGQLLDRHCYMYRAVKRVLERQAARALPGQGEADPAAHPRVEAL